MSLRQPKKRRTNRNELLRDLPGAIVTADPKVRKGSKYADPEDVLQGEVNDFLAQAGQFHFRIPASVYQRANDKSITGWPDNPMITRLQHGLAVLGPLELKKEGKTLSEGQERLKPLLGTVEADNWQDAYAYILWFRYAAEHVRRLLAVHPLPPLPGKAEKA